VVGRIASATLVGREMALASLRGARDRAETGIPTLTIVSGEAGVGKTRLTREASAEARADGWNVLTGSTIGPGQAQLPFGPVTMALRPHLNGADDAEIERLVGPGRPYLARLMPEIGPAAPAGGADDDRYLQGRIFAAITTTIERLAAERPVVLVLEDIHWADATSRALLAHVLSAIQHARVLIVATVRDEALAERGPLADEIAELDRRMGVVRIRLEPLDRAQTAALVRELGGEAVEPTVVEGLFRRSGGLPFYVEELLWLGDATIRDDMPPSVRDIVLAKVADLDPATQRLLQAAAVVGAAIDDGALCAIADLTLAQGTSAIRQAMHRHVLVRTADDRLAFRHDLTREAIYADLLAVERRRWHATVADALASAPASGPPHEHAARLALHRDRAGEPGPALAATTAAFRALMEAGAWQESLDVGRRALELWLQVDDPVDTSAMLRHELLAGTAAAAFRASELPTSIELIEQAIDVLGNGDRLLLGRYLERLAWYAYNGAQTELSVRAGEEAIATIPTDPPTRERARALSTHANRLATLNRDAEGLEIAEASLAVAEAVGDRAEIGRALHVRGLARAGLGRLIDGIADLESSLAISEETLDDELSVLAVFDLGWAAWAAGDHFRAVEMAHAGLQLVGRLGLDPIFRHMMEMNRIEMLYYRGDWREIGDVAIEHDPRATVLGLGQESYLATRIIASHGEEGGLERLPEETPSAQEPQLETLWLASRVYAFAQLGDAGRAWDAVERFLRSRPDHRTAAEVVIDAAGSVADEVVTARARRGGDRATLGVAHDRFDRLAATLSSFGHDADGRPVSRVVEAARAVLEGERLRADGLASADPFLRAAELFAAMPWPEREGWARLRAAEALKAGGDTDGATREATAARRIAQDLGGRRLTGEIGAFIRRARIALAPGTDGSTDRLGDGAEATDADARPLPGDPYGLTTREREVLLLLVEGRTNREIADRLFISPKTAGVHVSNILGKLGVSNRVEAATIAHRLGLAE
jgi:DNA-binding CsgD family transcriptional regulator/tetratricopeptide (TPR) repeat protein